MKRETISYNTKKAMADALKKAMARRSLDSITVTSIVEECNITRSTFYYHFADIYDLMIWMFEQEALVLLEKSRDADTWSDGLLEVYGYVEQNAAVCRCALESPGAGRDFLKRFFADSVYGFMMRFIDSLGIAAKKEHKLFIAKFYSEAIVSVLIDWLDDGMKQTPEEMIRLNEIAIKGAVSQALLNSLHTA